MNKIHRVGIFSSSSWWRVLCI